MSTVAIAGDHPAYAIMGPARCQGCGTHVWWARGITRLDGKQGKGLAYWRERTGGVHRCGGKPEANASRRMLSQVRSKHGRHRQLANARAEWEARS